MCSENGVEMPASLAEDSEECAAWENKYGDQFPWINAMRNYRRINTVLKKCETMRRRVMPNGRVEFSFLYFGGDTGRWSGTGGWNPQNLPQSPFYFDADLQLTEEKTDLSVDLRARLTAGPGMTLAVSDLSAIEPRAASFMSRNKAMLEAFRAGFGPYAALARATMGWDGKDLAVEDPELYALCKAKSLAFMYGAGWLKFIDMAPMYIGQANADKILKVRPPEHEIVAFDAFIMGNEFNAGHVAKFKTNTEEQNWVWCNAWIHMRDFRAAHPELVAVWKTCGETLKKSIGGTCEIGIPSGRTLRFFNVTKRADGMVCRTTRGGSFYKYYAAKVFQNANQAFARDIFAEAILRIEAAGYPVVLHVHDEVVVEVPLGFDPKLLTALMVVPPAWCRSIPLASKTKLMPHYTK
jgi:DNA polymerase